MLCFTVRTMLPSMQARAHKKRAHDAIPAHFGPAELVLLFRGGPNRGSPDALPGGGSVLCMPPNGHAANSLHVSCCMTVHSRGTAASHESWLAAMARAPQAPSVKCLIHLTADLTDLTAAPDRPDSSWHKRTCRGSQYRPESSRPHRGSGLWACTSVCCQRIISFAIARDRDPAYFFVFRRWQEGRCPNCCAG